MTDKDAWNNFLETGSVFDYLYYTYTKNTGDGFSQEEENEVSDRRTDNQRNEYR